MAVEVTVPKHLEDTVRRVEAAAVEVAAAGAEAVAATERMAVEAAVALEVVVPAEALDTALKRQEQVTESREVEVQAGMVQKALAVQADTAPREAVVVEAMVRRAVVPQADTAPRAAEAQVVMPHKVGAAQVHTVQWAEDVVAATLPRAEVAAVTGLKAVDQAEGVTVLSLRVAADTVNKLGVVAAEVEAVAMADAAIRADCRAEDSKRRPVVAVGTRALGLVVVTRPKL